LTFSDLQYAFHGFGSFYPNLWHVVAALAAESSGASIPIAANALSIVIGGLIWPLGCIFFMRQVLGPNPIVSLATGIFSVGLASFPMILIGWGVLYPNLLGLALIPVGLGALVLASGIASTPRLGAVLGWIAFIALMPGISMAHPNALVSLLGIGLPVLCVAWWLWFRKTRESGRRQAVIALVVALAGLLVYAAVFIVVRPPASAATWGPIAGWRRALYMGLLNAEYGNVPAFAMTALAIVGVIGAFLQRKNRWLVASAVLVQLLFFFTAVLPHGLARLILTGTWYSDIYRIIALFPIVFIPLAVIGVLWLGELAARVAPDFAGLPRSVVVSRVSMLSTVILIVVLGGVAQAEFSMQSATQWTAKWYRLNASSKLLTADERALIARLPREIPKDAVIAGDPWTGTAMAWALADRRVIAPHIYGARTPSANLILESLRNATPSSAVCRAVNKEHVGYALDFGTKGIFGFTNQYPGVQHLNSSKAVTLVDRIGNAALYRITGCESSR
jgi:hypothetical protein